ncbi:hypothetical protein HELRODRAFT_169158 [Helobdella robusta]|uniref:Uncharacterized protein n=1 Tax=Helobdella robusta TaxID=6412 RepID=T1F1I0_HELRO|nr:hypothetical protein HELRODRAFT_169158 [Helobdella robusta]ESO08347.1 hypothetical protein HELRODRAFT_169158 [Helobdella robusta]
MSTLKYFEGKKIRAHESLESVKEIFRVNGSNRPGRQRGGCVVISLKSSISSQIRIVLPHVVNDALKTLFLKGIIDSEPYFICAIYHPLNHPSYEFSTLMGPL